MHDSNRREFLARSGTAGLGLGCLHLPWPRPSLRRGLQPRADAVIQIHLDGGLSHLDTFDPKPDAPIEVRGPFGTIASKLNGEPLSELLGKTATIADRLVIVRSMTHSEADHDRGQHSVLTGYQPSPALVYPSLGAVVSQQLGVRNALPPYVCVPSAGNRFLGTGYLSAAFAPFAVGGNPAADGYRVRDLQGAKEIDGPRTARRKDLLHQLDAGFQALGEADAVHAVEEYYRLANALIESQPARAAFEVGAEPEAMKARYGRRTLGMSCLLARRLVQAGSRYVVVQRGGFDHHSNIGNDLPAAMADVDQAFAALVTDLDERGLLDRTLVLLTTEFGRTPRLNGDAGRDHWPRVFSVVLAGGGCKRGFVFGSSNASGAEPERDPVSPGDLAATVFTLLGIDPTQKLRAPGDRPIDLVREGRVLTGILA